MIDFSSKYKNIDTLVADYKPLKFKIMGINKKERLPYGASLLRPINSIVFNIKLKLGHELSYFDYRAYLSPIERKSGDLKFLTHYGINRCRDAQNGSRSEQIRYYWYLFRYLPELSYIEKQLYDKDGKPVSDISDDVSSYILRWQYLLNVSNSFKEFIHGTDPQTGNISLRDLH